MLVRVASFNQSVQLCLKIVEMSLVKKKVNIYTRNSVPPVQLPIKSRQTEAKILRILHTLKISPAKSNLYLPDGKEEHLVTIPRDYKSSTLFAIYTVYCDLNNWCNKLA